MATSQPPLRYLSCYTFIWLISKKDKDVSVLKYALEKKAISCDQ